MSMIPITKKNLILLVLTLTDGKPLSPIQLQKAVFLLQERLPEGIVSKVRYEFVPYKYGPFCTELNKDVATLAEQGLAVPKPNTRGDLEYDINNHEVARGFAILQQMPPAAATLSRGIVTWVRVQSFNTLVKTIYKKYPSFKVNSVFRETSQGVDEEIAYDSVPPKQRYTAKVRYSMRRKGQPLEYPLDDE